MPWLDATPPSVLGSNGVSHDLQRQRRKEKVKKNNDFQAFPTFLPLPPVTESLSACRYPPPSTFVKTFDRIMRRLMAVDGELLSQNRTSMAHLS